MASLYRPLSEEKGTCCHKCGHVHVKGTAHPTPYLTGNRSCKKTQSVNELSLQSTGIPEFMEYVKQHPDAVDYLNFTSLSDLEEYLQDSKFEDWDELRKELEQYKKEIREVETDAYCPTCLAEYLVEYAEKIEEAEYKGRKVSLGKPFLTPDGPKKRSVYVKNAKGNVVKVNFGDPNMRIKKSIPARRKSYRARHHCDNPGPRWKANYWSCRAW